MQAMLVRVLVVATILPCLCTSLASNKVLAQQPGTNNLGITGLTFPADLGQIQPVSVDDESRGDAFLRFFTEGEWYFSWGYNTESWSPTNIHVSQPALGNNFTVHGVRGHDEAPWNTGLINADPFGPQSNIRIGRFIDEDHTLAVEFNLDHTKYTSTLGQTAHVTGTIAGVPTDANIRLDANSFSYKLHNLPFA